MTGKLPRDMECKVSCHERVAQGWSCHCLQSQAAVMDTAVSAEIEGLHFSVSDGEIEES